MTPIAQDTAYTEYFPSVTEKAMPGNLMGHKNITS